MKLKKTEIVVILLALLCISFTVGYFIGRDSVEGTVIIDTENQAYTALPVTPQVSETAKPTETQKVSITQSAQKVNINTATAGELESLPGIGEVLAQRIVEYREKNGPFATIADIVNVDGIGSGIYAGICDSITVE